MVLARKIAYNVVLNSFLKVFSTVVLSLLSIRLMTGYLGQEGFGKYATILAFFAFFTAIADLGLGSVTAREISRESADEGKILGNVVALRLTSSITLFLLSPAIIYFFGYSADVKTGILIAALAMVFSTLSSVLNGIFQKNLAMDRVAMVEFLGKLLQVGVITIVVSRDFGFIAIVCTLIISLSFNAVTVLLLSRRYATFRLHFDFSFWKAFLKNSFPMGVTAIITFAYFKMDTILLSLLQSNAHVGIYNVAYKIMENLIFFPAMLAGLILPLLSRFIFTDRNRFEEIANKTFKVFCIIVVPIVVGTWFLAADIIAIVSGTGFEESAGVLRILIFALGWIFFGSYFNMLLVVGNAQKQLMQTLIFVAVFNIGLNLFLIPHYSYIGAASTALATEALVALATGYLTYRFVGYIPSFENIKRILLSGGVMALFLFLLEPTSFVLSGTISMAVYIGMLWLTRAISSAEIAGLFEKDRAPVLSPAERVETLVP
ncbi:MAG: flippase [Candidatus Moranbacteria bacterium]|nr:flippase [Candidatus Moranbacteria bacterium]